jgi:glycosyltransferase involved in cell wall biosynthesis
MLGGLRRLRHLARIGRSGGSWLAPIAASSDSVGRRDVVIITPSGVEHRSRILKIGQSLLSAGHSVAFFAKRPPSDRGSDVLVGTKLGCPVLYFPDAHSFLEAARTRVPALNWQLMVDYLNAAMWHYVRAIRPRVIHTFGSAAIGLGHDFRERLRRDGHAAAWFHDFPEYTSGHLFRDDRVADSAEDIEWRRTVLAHEAAHTGYADHNFTVSPALADALARDSRLDPPPSVLLNVPRLADFDPNARSTIRRTLRLPAATPLLVYSGGATPLRGLHTLVAALAALTDAHLALMIQSRTPYVRALLRQAQAAGCASRLHIIPYRAPNEIPSFLRDATIGVHPLTRYGNAEVALPNKLFDYLHAGLPVVVSDCSSMAGFVREHGIGEVFRAGDSAALVEALRRALARNEALRQAATPQLRAGYCWEREETILLDVYRRAFANIGRPPSEGVDNGVCEAVATPR